jgi:hypothetical protein
MNAPPPLPPATNRFPTWAIVLIVTGVVGVVGIAIIGLLAAIAIPNFIKARQLSQRAACIANLRTIDGAKESWRLAKNKSLGEIPTDGDLFGPTSYILQKPFCPAGGGYIIGPLGAKPSCNIVGHTL